VRSKFRLEAVKVAFKQPFAHRADAALLDGIADGERGGSLQGLTHWLLHRIGDSRGRGTDSRGGRRSGDIEDRSLERVRDAQPPQHARSTVGRGRRRAGRLGKARRLGPGIGGGPSGVPSDAEETNGSCSRRTVIILVDGGDGVLGLGASEEVTSGTGDGFDGRRRAKEVSKGRRGGSAGTALGRLVTSAPTARVVEALGKGGCGRLNGGRER